jgi:hypothetical protein
MERRDGEPERLKALVQGNFGTGVDSASAATENESSDRHPEVPDLQAVSLGVSEGTRTPDRLDHNHDLALRQARAPMLAALSCSPIR